MCIKKLFFGIGFWFTCASSSLAAMSLHEAAEKGNLERVKELLTLDKTRINEQQQEPKTFDTPLHLACRHGHLPIVEFLIANGANINAQNYWEMVPLQAACLAGHVKIVELLFNKGAWWQDVFPPILLLACDNETYTPGHLEVVKYLVEKQHVQLSKELLGISPLRAACANGHSEIVRYLIQKGANINAITKDDGQTPLHVACEKNNFELVKMLVENGAQLEIKDKTGQQPRDLAPQESPIRAYLDEKILKSMVKTVLKKRRTRTPLELALRAFSQSCETLTQSLQLTE